MRFVMRRTVQLSLHHNCDIPADSTLLVSGKQDKEPTPYMGMPAPCHIGVGTHSLAGPGQNEDGNASNFSGQSKGEFSTQRYLDEF